MLVRILDSNLAKFERVVFHSISPRNVCPFASVTCTTAYSPATGETVFDIEEENSVGLEPFIATSFVATSSVAMGRYGKNIRLF